ncbi:MAG: 30S ribosomal protein S9 [Rickettsia sp.]|nr:30S ribosomal protein S9 [Rickettsia sp.]
MEIIEKKIEIKAEANINSSKNSSSVLKKADLYATGKRKTSVARVWLKKGKGEFIVNKKRLSEYFVRSLYVDKILTPFKLLQVQDNFSVYCTVKGGGTTGQADSISHGVSKALSNISDDFHKLLSSKKLLTRDSRVVERKKYGQHKARKSTQFSKR